MNSTQFIWNMQKRNILYNIIKNRIENNELRGELIMSAYLLILMGDINHSGCVIMQPEMSLNPYYNGRYSWRLRLSLYFFSPKNYFVLK